MRSVGSPAELERRRRLAVRRLRGGYTTAEVAAFLGVDPSTVRRWRLAARAGPGGRAARKAPGRPPKLARWQEKAVGRWLADPATAFGFPTEWWTGRRLARLVAEEFGVAFHPG